MRKLCSLFFSIVFVVTGFWVPVCFADDEKKAIVLDEVVVSATRTETMVDLAPANVSVVDENDLERMTFDRLDEAMKYEVGVFEGDLRGISGTHTLLMLNGMPMNSGWYGGKRWDNLPIENVERIEIVRGPGSALYGGNAMGGVINVITQLPDEFEADLSSRFGEDDFMTYRGSVGDRIGKFRLMLSFEKDEELTGYPTKYVQKTLKSGGGDLSGGFYTQNSSGKDTWIVGDYGNRNVDQWNVGLAAAYDLTDTGSIRFDGQVGYYGYEYERPNSYVYDEEGNTTYNGKVDTGDGHYVSITEKSFLKGLGDSTNHSYMTTYTDQFGVVSFIGKIGYQYEFYEYTSAQASSGDGYDNAPGYVREFDTDTYFTDLQFSFDLNDRNKITTGVYGRYNDFNQEQYDIEYYRDKDSKISDITDVTQGADRYYAYYIQDEVDLIRDLLTMYVGARYDYWEAYDGKSGEVENLTVMDDVNNSAVSPKLALVWTPYKDTTVKGSIGKAFRAPTLYNLYRTYESTSGSITYSNPDLDPETILNYEVGVVQYFWDRRMRFDATVFYSTVENLIYSYSDDNGDKHFDNAGEARVQGIELSSSVNPWEFLTLWANYTYNDGRITEYDRDKEMVGKRITDKPDAVVNVGVDGRYHWFKASLSGQYTGIIYQNKYNTDIQDVYGSYSNTWLWDAKLTCTVPVKDNYLENIEFSLSIENLFDEEYYYTDIERDRTFYGQVKFNW